MLHTQTPGIFNENRNFNTEKNRLRVGAMFSYRTLDYACTRVYYSLLVVMYELQSKTLSGKVLVSNSRSILLKSWSRSICNPD